MAYLTQSNLTRELSEVELMQLTDDERIGTIMGETLKRISARMGMAEIPDSFTEDVISMICEKVSRGYK